jgi:pimeloyl-ACP methyl ester carboxylesterase
MFYDQIKVFDDRYHVILWDARGHGESKLYDGKPFVFVDMISDFLKLCEKYKVEKATLIGQSMGGNLAQAIAYQHPSLVEKLVLIGCTKNTGKLTLAEKITLRFTKFIFLCYPWNTLITQSSNACSNREDVRQYVRECFAKIDKRTFIDIIIAVTGCLLEDEAYRFKQPVLLLCGQDDKSGNIRKIAKHWADSDDNITLLMIEHAGHNANQDAPEVVNALISEFLCGS